MIFHLKTGYPCVYRDTSYHRINQGGCEDKNENGDNDRDKMKNKRDDKQRKKDKKRKDIFNKDRDFEENNVKNCGSQSNIRINPIKSNDLSCIGINNNDTADNFANIIDTVTNRETNKSGDEAHSEGEGGSNTTNDPFDNTARKTNHMGNALSMTPLQRFSVGVVLNASICAITCKVTSGNKEKTELDLFEFTIPAKLLSRCSRESELAYTKLNKWIDSKRIFFDNYILRKGQDQRRDSSKGQGLDMHSAFKGRLFIVDAIFIRNEEMTLPFVIL